MPYEESYSPGSFQPIKAFILSSYAIREATELGNSDITSSYHFTAASTRGIQLESIVHSLFLLLDQKSPCLKYEAATA